MAEIDLQLTSLPGQLEEVYKKDLAKFKRLARNKDVPPVILAR